MNAEDMSMEARSVLMAGQKAPGIRHTDDPVKARQVAEEFESFVLGQMLQPMFENLDVDEPFGGGSSEKIWRSMQVEEYGKAIARNGGIGIADHVMSEILRIQETDSAKALSRTKGV
jgi:Rod binding domain-containing protein